MTDTTLDFTFSDVEDEINFELPDIKLDEEEPKEEPKEAEEPAEDEKTEELHNEYLVIYDAIMFEDKFEKQYNLGKKYSAVYATRSTKSDIDISRNLDRMEFSTMHALQTMSAVLTMSHSLMSLNGTDLSEMTTTERYKFIQGKSSHLIEVLSKHMVEFDALVRDALEYGEANF